MTDEQPAIVPAITEVEKKLQPALENLPGPQQTLVRETIHELLVAFADRPSVPRLDAETAKVITASLDRDNDNKFKYLSQKQADVAKQSERNHALAMKKHDDGVRLLWPILIAAIVVVLGSGAAGIYFIANGQEGVGSSILTGISGLLFGYLGGLGTSKMIRPSE